MSAPSVLIVEDNRVDAHILQEFLERDGRFGAIYRVADGQEALDLWSEDPKARAAIAPENFPPDLLFLDLNMPRMTGFEFLDAFARVEGTPGKTKVVVLLGGVDPEEDQARALKYDVVSACLEKPFDAEQIDILVSSTTTPR